MNVALKKFRMFSLVGLLCFGTISLLSQNKMITELEEALELETRDTARVDLYNKLSWEYHRVDIDQSFAFAEKALKLAQRINYKKGLGRANNLLGICYDFRGNRQKAIELNQITLRLGQEIGDSALLSMAYNDLGAYSFYDNKEALKNFQKALELTPYDDALGRVFTLSNIGFLHLEEGHDTLGKQYLKAAVTAAQRADDYMSLSLAHFNMGTYYHAEPTIDSAIYFYQQAFDIANASNDQYTIGSCLVYLGKAYADKGGFEMAMDHLLRANELFEKLESYAQLDFGLLQQAETYVKMGDYYSAKETALKGYEMAQVKGIKYNENEYFKLLAAIYAKLNDYENAFEYQSKLLANNDTLYQREKQEIFAEIEGRYQLGQKEAENRRLLAVQEKDALAIRLRNIVILSCGLILILFLGLLFYLNKANHAKNRFNLKLKNEVARKTADLSFTNEELKRTNEELERFTFIASHDLKEPIRNIINFIQLSKRELARERLEELRTYFPFIEQSSLQLYNLIEDVLEFSRLGKEEVPTKEISVAHVLNRVKETLAKRILERKVKITSGVLPEVISSESHLYLIIKNLLENAIKYNQSEPPVIHVDHKMLENEHLFRVADNGIGINPAYHNQVFEMFTRLHNRDEYQGSGLGLAICKKIVDAFGGRIWVETQQPQGSRFCFTIPIKNNSNLVESVDSLKFAKEPK